MYFEFNFLLKKKLKANRDKQKVAIKHNIHTSTSISKAVITKKNWAKKGRQVTQQTLLSK